MTRDPKDAAREAAAAAAVERIEPGSTIGLGSGRAVWKVVQAIAERGIEVRAAAASVRTEHIAAEAGIQLVEFDTAGRLDLAIDGADEVDGQLGLVKGGGGAMLREKLIVAAAQRFLVVAETDKKVARLGDTRPVPVEVVRFGWRSTRERLLADVVPDAELRLAGDSPYITDEGHVIFDCTVPAGVDIEELAAALKSEIGVVEHGFFLGMADEVLLGTPDGEVETLSASAR
ncbi:MAG TPA: ribose-5-phosphate isomerase RpiA [Thermoleophilaceae bacterium]|nr:ribose-5-phosphate isomerase RpiA [Thermoleophilaceae bacterium]